MLARRPEPPYVQPWRERYAVLVGRIPNDLEDSEDRRSVGGHGNQHVRLRIAQVDRIETSCPALAALRCLEPRQASRFETKVSLREIRTISLTLPAS